MKKAMLFFCLCLVALTGCENKVTEMVTYKINEPVFMATGTFRNLKRQIRYV